MRYKRIVTILIMTVFAGNGFGQLTAKSQVDYEGFKELADKVYTYRESRLIDIETFNAYSKDASTIILDTRSKSSFDVVHVKGAVHLNFSDFTAEKLAKVIPNRETRILIYCNNNFEFDRLEAMISKYKPLALNIPTFINLYGYGYTNIFELKDFLDQDDERVEFDGTYKETKL